MGRNKPNDLSPIRLFVYLTWWEEIRCPHLQESQSPMGQLWREHISERKPFEKNSMARAEKVSNSTAMCSLGQ